MADDISTTRSVTVPKTAAALDAAQKATTDVELKKNATAVAFNQEVYFGNTPEKLLASLNAGSRRDIEAVTHGLGKLGSLGRDVTITAMERIVVEKPLSEKPFAGEAETIATLEALRRQDPIALPEGSIVSPNSAVESAIVWSLQTLKNRAK